MKTFDIAFIGAGASSLMAASFLKDKAIAIIEASPKIAPKIKISGGGKCNFTNKIVSENNYLGDKELIKKTFEKFDEKDLLKFFKEQNLEFELKEDGKYFCKNRSDDIISIFAKLTKHCKFFLEHCVKKVEFKDEFVIKTEKEEIRAKKLVISSGGLSYKSLGASDIGFQIAKDFNHNIINPTPALVGFTLQKDQFWMKNLSGISIPVSLHVKNKKFSNNLLFAHKGISGPAVLSGSLYWDNGLILVDFLPNYNIVKLLSKKSKKQISSLLPIPKRFTKEYLKSIELDDISTDKLKNDDILKIAKLNNYEFSPAGNFGYTKAEVTRGGVDTDEINHLSFESIIKKDLYFIGEVLNVTGELGGYNFQWAFSSGRILAKYILSKDNM